MKRFAGVFLCPLRRRGESKLQSVTAQDRLLPYFFMQPK